MLSPNKIQKKTKNSNFSVGVYETNYRGVISAWQGKRKSRQVIFQINQQLLSTDHQGILLVLIICSN